MSERPIEEVIGWERSDFDGCWWDDDAHWHYAATVDDLATWLDGHTNDWGFDDRRLGGPWQVFYFPDVTSVATDQADEEPTLLAALTAAVRKVADA